MVTIDPPNYATVGTNVTPKIVFNKPLNPIYVNNSYFQLYLNDTGQWIPLTVTLSPDGKTVTLTPQEALLPNTEYRYYAGSGLQDENGNDVNNGWYYFYTGSGAVTSGPTVTCQPGGHGHRHSAERAGHRAGQRADGSDQLDAELDPTAERRNASGGNRELVNAQELTFAPTSALAAGTTYTVKVTGFTDANGNAVVPSTLHFHHWHAGLHRRTYLHRLQHRLGRNRHQSLTADRDDLQPGS